MVEAQPLVVGPPSASTTSLQSGNRVEASEVAQHSANRIADCASWAHPWALPGAPKVPNGAVMLLKSVYQSAVRKEPFLSSGLWPASPLTHLYTDALASVSKIHQGSGASRYGFDHIR